MDPVGGFSVADEEQILTIFRALSRGSQMSLIQIAEALLQAERDGRTPGLKDLLGLSGSASGGLAEVTMELRTPLLNRRGVAHGGVICSLLDEAIGMAVHSLLPEGGRAVTAQLNAHFLNPALPGTLLAKAHVVRSGKRIVVGEGEVRQAGGEVVAKGAGTWVVVQPGLE
jgi:uncharacterized protein (TIGR00369 family)